MSQSNHRSIAEAVTNTVVGWFISFLLQLVIFDYYGAHFPLWTNLQISFAFVIASVLRGYLLRRAFNWYDRKKPA